MVFEANTVVFWANTLALNLIVLKVHILYIMHIVHIAHIVLKVYMVNTLHILNIVYIVHIVHIVHILGHADMIRAEKAWLCHCNFPAHDTAKKKFFKS